MSERREEPLVEQVATGWVAYRKGLAGRGATREEAVQQYAHVVELVNRLSGQCRTRNYPILAATEPTDEGGTDEREDLTPGEAARSGPAVDDHDD
jgi:hypothetical protein